MASKRTFPSKRVCSIGFSAILLCLFALIAKEIDLSTSDLGRHLANGRILLEQGLSSPVLKTNLYSYPQSSFPTINHHWGSGVIFELIRKMGGFLSLSFFQMGITLITFAIALLFTSQISDSSTALMLGTIWLPIFASRTQVRPESFTYLFFIVFVWLLERWRIGRIRNGFLWILPLLQAAWINLHIYFFMGILSIATYLMFELAYRRKQNKWPFLFTILGFSLAALYINPIGNSLILYPFRILNQYGYPVLENWPIWVIQEQGLLSLVLPAFYVSLILFLGLWLSNKFRTPSPPLFFLTVLTLGMACFVARNILLFGLISLPTVGLLLSTVLRSDKKSDGKLLTQFGLGLYIACCIFGFSFLTLKVLPKSYDRFGFGLAKGNEDSIQFFKKNLLHGPVFNNFDTGGFLIYSLYPSERVFVDNRPEAYPVSFFKDEYIPIQEDPNSWNEADAKYHFNVIFISLHDGTYWGQSFRKSLLADPRWAAVYLDHFSVIFLKRNSENQAVIQKFEIHQERQI